MQSLQEKINALFAEAGVDNAALAGHVHNAAVAHYEGRPALSGKRKAKEEDAA